MANPYWNPPQGESLFSLARRTAAAAGTIPSSFGASLGGAFNRNLEWSGESEDERNLRRGFPEGRDIELPTSLSDMRGGSHLPKLLANAANQESGSEESKEKGSGPSRGNPPGYRGSGDTPPPPTHITEEAMHRRDYAIPKSLDASEYGGLRRNQTVQPSLDEMSDKPLIRQGSLDEPIIPGSPVKWGSREGLTTTGGPQYSLSDMAGRAHARDIYRSEHEARLAGIGPDPYDARQKDMADARKQEQEYQESQPASQDEMNRLGLSGNYTRGQIKKIIEVREAEASKADAERYKADAAYRAAIEAARINAAAEHSSPGQQREMDAQKHGDTLARDLATVPREAHREMIEAYVQQKAPQFADVLYKRFGITPSSY